MVAADMTELSSFALLSLSSFWGMQPSTIPPLVPVGGKADVAPAPAADVGTSIQEDSAATPDVGSNSVMDDSGADPAQRGTIGIGSASDAAGATASTSKAKGKPKAKKKKPVGPKPEAIAEGDEPAEADNV